MKIILGILIGTFACIVALLLAEHDKPIINSMVVEKEVEEVIEPEVYYPELVCAMIYAESGWKENLGGNHGEYGLMQCRSCLWKDACKYVKIKKPYIDKKLVYWNVYMGFVYYLWLEDQWRNKGYSGEELIKKSVMSYNTGFSHVKRGYIPRITSRHWAKVKKMYNKYKKEGLPIQAETYKIPQIVEDVLDRLEEIELKEGRSEYFK